MVTRTISRVRLSQLVEDFTIYPRHAVDQSHVADLTRAIEAGDTLPPVIADSRTKRIVDGFHRRRAHAKASGEDAEIDVELRDYPSEAALLEDAVRLNSQHGRKLDRQDQIRSALMLRDAGVSGERIAVVLHTTQDRVVKLIAQVVIVNHPDSAPETQPAKPVVLARPGEGPRELTPGQYDIMKASSGWRTAQTVTQLTRELESGMIVVDSKLRPKLEALAAAISKVL